MVLLTNASVGGPNARKVAGGAKSISDGNRKEKILDKSLL